MSWRTAVSGVLLILSVLAASRAADPLAREKRVVVQGRVLAAPGEGGEGMGGWPVLLISTQRYIELNRFTSGGEVATVARATTDDNGFFSISVARRSGYHFWFLRFLDPEHFDPVRHLPPEDVEITRDARRGRVAAVEKIIEQHPDWPEVERRIAQAGGAGTPKGRILRTIGLPEKSVRDESSGEDEWWYFTRGIVYTFRGEDPTGSRRFDPVKPPPRGEARPTGGEGR